MFGRLKWQAWGLMAGVLWALAHPAQPAWAQAVVQSHLVTAAWVQQQQQQQQLGPAALRVLDASPTQLHRAGHIPGAISADMMVFGPTGATPQQMQQRLRGWGISAGQRIVIVDQGGSYQAPRLFWDLAYHGVPTEQLFILNGGMAQWRVGDLARE